MELESEQSAAAQMDASAYQEDQVIKSKEAQAHIMESEILLNQGLENSQDAKRDIHNGK